MTVWCGPESSPFFGAFYSAVKMHGSPAVSAPPGPDFHQFANRQTAERLMAEAGFSKPDMSVVDCVLDLERPERMFEIFERGTVRAAMLLSSQPPQSRAAIRAALVKTALEQFSAGGRFFVPVPAVRLCVSTPAD